MYKGCVFLAVYTHKSDIFSLGYIFTVCYRRKQLRNGMISFFILTFLRALFACTYSIIRDVLLLLAQLLSFRYFKFPPNQTFVRFIGIDKKWLEEQLQKKSFLPSGVSLLSVRIVNLNARGQSASSVYQVILEYENIDREVGSELHSYIAEAGDAPKSNLPPSFILKFSGAGFSGRLTNLLRNEYREALVYDSDVLANTSGGVIRTPQIVYARGIAFLGEHIIIMENMRLHTGFSVADVLGSIGHQPKHGKGERRAALQLLASILGKLHAKSWMSSALLTNCKQLSGRNWYAHANNFRDFSAFYQRWSYNFAIAYSQNCWGKTKKFFEHNKKHWKGRQCEQPYDIFCPYENRPSDIPLTISNRVVEFIEQSLAHSTFENFSAALVTKPFCIGHGDCHADNLFVICSKNKRIQDLIPNDIIFFDVSDSGFQDPTLDLANIFLTNIVNNPNYSTEELVELIDFTIREFYNSLISNGVDAEKYTFESCEIAFSTSALQKFCWLFPVFASQGCERISLVQYIHDAILFFLSNLTESKCVCLKPLMMS